MKPRLSRGRLIEQKLVPRASCVHSRRKCTNGRSKVLELVLELLLELPLELILPW